MVFEQMLKAVSLSPSKSANSGMIGQEKSTNCATKAADVLDKCLAVKRNANPLIILVYLQLV